MAKDFLDRILDRIVQGDFKGWIGEKATEWELNFARLLGKKGKILRNIYLPKEDGSTTEIDVVFITQKGIFVIESKNYSGWIFGDENGYTWTAMLPNGDKSKFYNPIKQNRIHMKWLKYYLNEDIPLFSIIAFSERCELKKINVHTEDVVVIKRDCLYSEIRKKWDISPDVVNENKIEFIFNKLQELTDVDHSIKLKHIENIQKKKENMLYNEEKQSSKKCPKCGQTLALRIAKKGENKGKEFWGCSNFPKCRYTENKELNN